MRRRDRCCSSVCVCVCVFFSTHLLSSFLSLSPGRWLAFLACATVRICIHFSRSCFAFPSHHECTNITWNISACSVSVFTSAAATKAHKYWMNDSNQYIRIIKMFAFSQTGFSTHCTKLYDHWSHTQTHVAKPLHGYTYMCLAASSECIHDLRARNDNNWKINAAAQYVSLVIDILVVLSLYSKRECILSSSLQSLADYSMQ